MQDVLQFFKEEHMARKMKTMKGNDAAAYVSYAFTEVAAIYPITPSSDMAEETDAMSARGVKNIFGETVVVTEMQSEAGAAGAVHGSLQAGALTTTYTASQGLLLMIPNMYKIAGELLPGVIDVSARCVASHALNINGDHSDVYACRQTGYAMICAGNVQEVMDLGAVAHLASIKGRVPFLHFFDGFRTSHEIQKIEIWDYDELKDMTDMDAVDAFRARALNPEHPVLRGSHQYTDIFFQAREACNPYYEKIVDITEDYMHEVNRRIGSNYQLFNYYGAPDAERVIIAMGSACDTLEETVDFLNARGEKVGLIKVRLYRPFSAKHLVAAIPASVKSISVLDRTKEPGALGEPLYLDVCAALRGTAFKDVPVYGGRYGLGGKDTNPANYLAVYKNMTIAEPKAGFTIGIVDDLTGLSLPLDENPDTSPAGTYSCKFWGIGGDGTVGANQDAIKIIGDSTDMYVQGYFAYDSKKTGGITISHLRFGDKPIKSTYFIHKADFVACHNPSYVDKYDMLSDLKPGGVFLLNCAWGLDELSEILPGSMKKALAEKNAQFYTMDAIGLAKEIFNDGRRTNTSLQSAFFNLTGIIPEERILALMKGAVTKKFSAKGENVVRMNHEAIDAGFNALTKLEIPADWAQAEDTPYEIDAATSNETLRRFVVDILHPIVAQKGDNLPVSVFADSADGTFPQGSSAFEKRGIAIDVPDWKPENCIQCNFCSYVCPHAVIRPVALTEAEAAAAPAATKTASMTGLPGYQFTLGISTLDCMGCAQCANVCPGRKGEKALVMEPIAEGMAQQPCFDYIEKLDEKPEVLAKFKPTTVKGSQFKLPLLEFSGACSGCGETPYAKLATQLYGDRMYIGNATGCSSIWGGSAPSTPYTVNKQGKGPAWANSLFEDTAEFSYGFMLSVDARRKRLASILGVFAEADGLTADNCPPWVLELMAASAEWIAGKDDAEASKSATQKLVPLLETAMAECGSCGCEWDALYQQALVEKDVMVKKSIWAFGGDGWAYDIGFGGLDHVIAQGGDINLLVFDTEVYSNTGGQASKATPTGAVAKFAASGMESAKKDLGQIAMSYGHVYVASVAMGADYNQCMKAFVEAESYPGPSVIIAYAPCINHGIKGGLGFGIAETRKAVESGYWHLYRYDPRLKEQGKNPFQLDSKPPKSCYREFIENEVRYSTLKRSFPGKAEELFELSAKQAKEKREFYEKLEMMYAPE